MDKIKQIRLTSDAQVRAEEDENYFVGYAAVFDVVTDLGYFRESVAPGAFSAALSRKDDTRVLFNHNPDLILARSEGGTLEMEEDEIGLRCKIQIPDTTLGRDLKVLIRQGIVSQMSFGFYIDEEEKRGIVEGVPWYEILSVTLFDVAPVTYPAYKETSIAVSRSLEARTVKIREEQEREEAAYRYRQRKIAVHKKRLYQF